MDRDSWSKVQQIFELALARPMAERDAFVRQACSGSEEIAREVESLLAAHDRPDSRLTRLELVAADAWEGRRIGPYLLERELGRGGMSIVYSARRVDAEFEQTVAIKVVRPGLQAVEMGERLQTERQILARLSHPNVAKLYDGGTTPEGLPYFVMEYVEGTRIDEYCDRRQLTLDERLGLFRQVCGAVGYAHRNLVIHRDLKPSNILVREDGAPVLLDFGIARTLLLERELEETTATGVLPMTLSYASPERFRARAITTASDVYSLGVLLYLLLTGELPRGAAEIERLARGDSTALAPPSLPSTVAGRDADGRRSRRRGATPRRLRRRLAGDLDAITMKALRAEPDDRYASVEQLVEDLDRARSGLAVRARDGGSIYRAGKFLGRHRIAVVLATAAAVVAAGLLLAFSRTATLAQRQRDQAHGIAQFLEGVFEISHPDRAVGETVTARELLDRASDRISSEFQGDPETRATLLDTVGDVYARLGLEERGKELLEQSLELRETMFGPDHPSVAESLHHLAGVALTQSHFEDAEALGRRALEIRRRRLGVDHPAVAESLTHLGQVAITRLDSARAEELLRRALEIRRKAHGPEHRQVAESLSDLGSALAEEGRLDEAEPMLTEALAMRRRLLGELHPEVAESLDDLGALHYRRADYATAESLYRQSLEHRRQFLPEDHWQISEGLDNVGRCLWAQARFEEGETVFRQALALSRRAYEGDHYIVARQLNNLGSLLQDRGGVDEAEALLRESLQMTIRVQGERVPAVLRARFNLADILVNQGRVEEAAILYQQCLDDIDVLGDRPEAAYPFAAYGGLMLRTGKPAEAESVLRRAVDMMTASHPAGHWRIALGRAMLGDALLSQGRATEARPLMEQGYAQLLELYGEEAPIMLRAAGRMLALYTELGETEEAERFRELLARAGPGAA